MKTKNILIVLIAIIFSAICLFVAKRCSEVPVETIVAKLDEVKDKNGKTHFRKKVEIGTTEIKVTVLPDIGFVPNFGSGLIWFVNEGKIYPYYKVGLDIKLKSVQK